MVREESLRARYVEYKGRDTVDSKLKKKEVKEVQTVSHFIYSFIPLMLNILNALIQMDFLHL